jgi:hypothetical protein
MAMVINGFDSDTFLRLFKYEGFCKIRRTFYSQSTTILGLLHIKFGTIGKYVSKFAE